MPSTSCALNRLTNPELLEGDTSDWKIKLIADEKAGTLTVSDNGIGMSRETIVENLGHDRQDPGTRRSSRTSSRPKRRTGPN